MRSRRPRRSSPGSQGLGRSSELVRASALFGPPGSPGAPCVSEAQRCVSGTSGRASEPCLQAALMRRLPPTLFNRPSRSPRVPLRRLGHVCGCAMCCGTGGASLECVTAAAGLLAASTMFCFGGLTRSRELSASKRCVRPCLKRLTPDAVGSAAAAPLPGASLERCGAR